MYESPTYVPGVSENSYARKVFLWLFIGLIVTAVSAYVFSETNLWVVVFSNQLIYWGMFIVELFLVFKISASLHKISAGAARVYFMLYSIMTGLTVAGITFLFGMETTFIAFAYTSLLFGSMALIGFTTKRDLMKFSSLFMAGLITLLIASVANMFLRLQGLDLVLSYVGIILFMGITAYDIQKMKRLYEANEGNDEALNKLAIFSALDLYLDFINIFLRIVQILGRNSRR